MGIFDRAAAALRQNINALLSEREDPAALIEQTLSEMQAALSQGQREFVTTLGTEKRLQAEVDAAEAEAARWEERAVLAVRKGDDALARDALRQKARLLKEAAQLRAQVGIAHEAAAKLRPALDELEQRARDLQARKSALAAQVRAARLDASALELTGERTGTGSALSDLQRLSQRIDALDAEAEVAAALGDPQRAELEARFAKLEQTSAQGAVEDELSALKRKLEGL